MSGALTKMNENLSTDDTDSHRFFFSLRSLRLCGSLFSQEFPMGLRRTKMNENNATIFILIRVLSYPCFHYQWLFSQECCYVEE